MNMMSNARASAKSAGATVRPSAALRSEKSGIVVPKGSMVDGVATIVGLLTSMVERKESMRPRATDKPGAPHFAPCTLHVKVTKPAPPPVARADHASG
jgi:hypothetical protein